MQCVIYKGTKKSDTYLYVERADQFQRVPSALLSMLGKLEFVMQMEIGTAKKLARADIDEVRRQLIAQGYYLQLPPTDRELSELALRRN